MKTLILTNEYPPYIYGGAGVHVDYLSRELARLMDVEVRCFGDQDSFEEGIRLRQKPSVHSADNQRLEVMTGSLRVQGFLPPALSASCPNPLKSIFTALQQNLAFNISEVKADLVHCHTWYTHFGGILAKLNYGLPLVITVHSLEPLRPWKREQLGKGYDFSCWIEKTALEMADAVIAVSLDTQKELLQNFNIKKEKLSIIYNGIDLQEYQPCKNPAILDRFGIARDQPYLLFVGRITRQKGIIHLLNAIPYLDPDFQVVLCAGAPDTPEIAEEMKTAVKLMQGLRAGIHWIDSRITLEEKVALYSQAGVFVCPSIYEPFGIINLEAMACETAVIASAVGGIPEVVIPEQTGLLVEVNAHEESPFEPKDPDGFARRLAEAINRVMSNVNLQHTYGLAGRQRAEQLFSWSAIASEVHKLYQKLLGNS